MKRTTNLSIIFGLVGMLFGNAFADLSDGLMAYYPFNGNANDETGNGYNGTVYGATLNNDRVGNPDSAYSFDGAQDYIDMGTSLDFPCASSYSVSVWFLNNGQGPHVNGYGQKIMSKATFFNDFWLSVYTSGHAPPYEGMLYWQQYTGGGPGPKGIADQSYNYMDNIWHHMVVNKDGNNGEMWVDGELKGTASTLTTVCNSQNLYVGYTDHPDFWQKNEGHWNGKIDDIRVYNRILSEDEIEQLFHEIVEVAIDIKPGSYPNCFNNNGHGVVPVAILGSAEFDVTQIVTDEFLQIQSMQVRIKGNGYAQCSVDDVSGDFSASPAGAPDGHPDLVCQFVDEDGVFVEGPGYATVTGFLTDGRQFVGKDTVCITQ